MDFIDKSSKLNDLSTYAKLVERAEKIGYEITKVVFRGYFASPRLQQMHDTSINARTKLKLEVLVIFFLIVKACILFFYSMNQN
jgi:hypothetical protein